MRAVAIVDGNNHAWVVAMVLMEWSNENAALIINTAVVLHNAIYVFIFVFILPGSFTALSAAWR